MNLSLVLGSLPSLRIPSILKEWLSGYLFAVPKKRTTHRTKVILRKNIYKIIQIY